MIHLSFFQKTNNIKKILDEGTQLLKEGGIPSSRRDARILLAHTLKCTDKNFFIDEERSLTEKEKRLYAESLHHYLQGTPLSRITKTREFWSLPFIISEGTLDPRADSETLVEAVLKRIPNKKAPLDILDLGTGSGCLLLALLSELPHSKGIGIDSSPDALITAQKNAKNLALDNRAFFLNADWNNLKDFTSQLNACNPKGQKKFNWVISNPPYIPEEDYENLAPIVKDYDPINALVAGKEGLDCYKQLSKIIPSLLKDEGKIALEIGKGQAPEIEKIFLPLTLSGIAHDLSHILRVMIFQPH